ncbi:CoA ester lyase [Pacificimonas sp. WHA3]|uniref:CoA ester lyase n=1 Tax=Pacificimonas pallii TaxID=2827236 RepID=A0ABS6SBP9_9SPHN|nr:CoA ester lyase [Pacificimonas pallii]MBV7255848.1 CoA ester lyase [Pacificimonas pallii]
MLRPRRSCLYMPGANARALEKARSLPVDVVIIDLEDAVAPEKKAEARAAACAAVKQGGYGRREVVIRVNALATDWGEDDLNAAVAAGPDAILLPKVETAAMVQEAAARTGGIALWVMIETPRAILDIDAICGPASTTPLTTIVMGVNDLGKDLRARQRPGRAAFQMALQTSVAAARCHGLTAIDGVHNDITDSAGLAEECEQGRDLGFDGKTLIHPSQIDICNRVFSPSDTDIRQAEAVVAAFARPENADRGVLKVGGQMVERLHLEEAERVLVMAAAIGAYG